MTGFVSHYGKCGRLYQPNNLSSSNNFMQKERRKWEKKQKAIGNVRSGERFDGTNALDILT